MFLISIKIYELFKYDDAVISAFLNATMLDVIFVLVISQL